MKLAEEVVCQECQSDILDEAMKCSKCKLHLRYSGAVLQSMKIYFVHLKHKDKTCVRNEAGYLEAQKRVEDIITNEKK